MSHIHQIGGNGIAAAEYEEYLARLRAFRLAKRREESGEKAGARTFDSLIDPDQDSGGHPEGETDEEAGEDAGGKQGWSRKA